MIRRAIGVAAFTAVAILGCDDKPPTPSPASSTAQSAAAKPSAAASVASSAVPVASASAPASSAPVAGTVPTVPVVPFTFKKATEEYRRLVPVKFVKLDGAGQKTAKATIEIANTTDSDLTEVKAQVYYYDETTACRTVGSQVIPFAAKPGEKKTLTFEPFSDFGAADLIAKIKTVDLEVFLASKGKEPIWQNWNLTGSCTSNRQPGQPAEDALKKRVGQQATAAFVRAGAKKTGLFKITSKAAKPIKFIDLAVFYYDKDGKVLSVENGSSSQGKVTLAAGKTADFEAGKDKAPDGTVAQEAEVWSVTFEDGEFWMNSNLIWFKERPKGG